MPVLTGTLISKSEDGGMARIAEIGGEEGLFVRVQSWDDDCQHPEMVALEGKRVRVTVEVIPDPEDRGEIYRQKMIEECDTRIRNGITMGAVATMNIGCETLLKLLKRETL